MKRASKAVISLLLAVILVFAELLPVSAGQATVDKEPVGVLIPTMHTSLNQKNCTRAFVTMQPGEQVYVLPIGIPEAGMLQLQVSYTQYSGAFAMMRCEVYADAACSQRMGYPLSVSYHLQQSDRRSYYMDKPQMAYLKFTVSGSLPDGDKVHLLVESALVKQGSGKLKANTYSHHLFGDGEQTARFSVDMPINGLLTFYITGEKGVRINPNITLYNSKGKAVSQTDLCNSKKNKSGYYAVKKQYVLLKGRYEVKVTMRGGFTGGSLAKYSYKEVTDRSGSSMKTAASLSASGKSKTGALTANSKAGNADWYKLHLKEGGNYLFLLNGYGDGSVRLEVTDSTGKNAWYGSRQVQPGKNALVFENLPRGVCYVKVYKTDQLSGLWYSLQVKPCG